MEPSVEKHSTTDKGSTSVLENGRPLVPNPLSPSPVAAATSLTAHDINFLYVIFDQREQGNCDNQEENHHQRSSMQRTKTKLDGSHERRVLARDFANRQPIAVDDMYHYHENQTATGPVALQNDDTAPSIVDKTKLEQEALPTHKLQCLATDNSDATDSSNKDNDTVSTIVSSLPASLKSASDDDDVAIVRDSYAASLQDIKLLDSISVPMMPDCPSIFDNSFLVQEKEGLEDANAAIDAVLRKSSFIPKLEPFRDSWKPEAVIGQHPAAAYAAAERSGTNAKNANAAIGIKTPFHTAHELKKSGRRDDSLATTPCTSAKRIRIITSEDLAHDSSSHLPSLAAPVESRGRPRVDSWQAYMDQMQYNDEQREMQYNEEQRVKRARSASTSSLERESKSSYSSRPSHRPFKMQHHQHPSYFYDYDSRNDNNKSARSSSANALGPSNYQDLMNIAHPHYQYCQLDTAPPRNIFHQAPRHHIHPRSNRRADHSYPPVPPLSEATYLKENGEQLFLPSQTEDGNARRGQDVNNHNLDTSKAIANHCDRKYHCGPHSVLPGIPVAPLLSSFPYSQQPSGALQPYYNRQVLTLCTDGDENWLSEFLVFVRQECLEVFPASEHDVSSRMNSKKVLFNQVGIRCRYCAHVPPRERTGRASSFPSSINRIYQSLTMMLRDHFTKCRAMPPDVKERYLDLKASTCQGATDSKNYWIRSATKLGLVDSEGGIRFRPPADGPR